MIKRFWTHLQEINFRSRFFAVAYFLLIFLFPVTGWNPILTLWVIDLYISWRNESKRAMKLFYVIAIAVIVIWIFSNLIVALFFDGRDPCLWINA